MTELRKTDFGLEVALGKIDGYSKVNKFGETDNADSGTPTDVWSGSITQVLWVPPTAARIHSILSTSDVDSDAGGAIAQGAGLRTVRVYGLPTWDDEEISEVVIMDGTDGTDTINSYVIIYRMEGLTWGASGVNTGTITAVAAVDLTVTAEITPLKNQSQMMIYGVPSTQSLQIKHLRAEIIKATGTSQRADGEVLVMPDPATNASGNVAWVNKENFLLIEDEQPWVHDYDPPKSIAGPCIIKITVTSNAADVKVIAAMDAYVVDN